MRQLAHRPQMCGAHGSLRRGEKPDRDIGTRGDHREDQRRTTLLVYAARRSRRRGGRAYRQRFLPRRASATPHGVRRRSAEARQYLSGRKCRLMLEIKNLHVEVGGKEILKGIDLTIE